MLYEATAGQLRQALEAAQDEIQEILDQAQKAYQLLTKITDDWEGRDETQIPPEYTSIETARGHVADIIWASGDKPRRATYNAN